MAQYYVNRNQQPNGDHEVHESTCFYLPSEQNRIWLGEFESCHGAVRQAQNYFVQVNGCYHCSIACHTG